MAKHLRNVGAMVCLSHRSAKSVRLVRHLIGSSHWFMTWIRRRIGLRVQAPDPPRGGRRRYARCRRSACIVPEVYRIVTPQVNPVSSDPATLPCRPEDTEFTRLETL